MDKKPEDRRSRRSQRLLKEGLLGLMREKRFSDISVRDITERMDLNRGTFYLHYPDTTALLQSAETDMLDRRRRSLTSTWPKPPRRDRCARCSSRFWTMWWSTATPVLRCLPTTPPATSRTGSTS